MIDNDKSVDATNVADRTGYCQECGRGLSIATLRRVGSGVFCVPCAIRQAGTGWQNVPSSGYPGAPASAGTRGPNPARAAVLGLVPGVGAMYNGQYAKGALHLVVFVVLLSLADNLNWVFYWFVWGWVFYQAFDAYHTARARRDGEALPNAFGWNDIGDRLGFPRSSASAPTPPPAATTPTPVCSSYGPVSAWAGSVPPPASGPTTSATTHPESAASSYGRDTSEVPFPIKPSDNPYAEPFVRSQSSYPPPVASASLAPGMAVPYTSTFVGGSSPAGTPPVPAPLTGIRRFPAGAAWLIGLGILFLFGNLEPDWHLGSRWLVPILLAGVAAWSTLRRWEQLRSLHGPVLSLSRFAGAIVGPLVLLTLAALLALDASHLLTMRRSWPALLVVWGALLTLQRSTPAEIIPAPVVEFPRAVPPPPPVRSTSGTGSFGL